MNIGEVFKVSKVLVKMICYYEQIGLIPPADWNDLGYRVYSQDDVHWLYFIWCVRDFGFLVVEIMDLLGLWNDKLCWSVDVKCLNVS